MKSEIDLCDLSPETTPAKKRTIASSILSTNRTQLQMLVFSQHTTAVY